MTSLFIATAVIVLGAVCAGPTMVWDNNLKKIVKVSDVGKPEKPAAVVSTFEQVAEYNQLVADHTGLPNEEPCRVAPSVEQSLETIHNLEFNDFGLDKDQLCAELMEKFHQDEIPIGMMQKVLKIRHYKFMSFLVDDSGSMYSRSGLGITRWQEAKQQIQTMLGIIQFLPRPTVEIHFLNRPDKVVIQRHLNEDFPEAPAAYFARAMQDVDRAFQLGPQGLTPMYKRMREVIEGYGDTPVLHYIFGDGAPSDKVARLDSDYVDGKGVPRDRFGHDLLGLDVNAQQSRQDELRMLQSRGAQIQHFDPKTLITDYVRHRPNPWACPITFISCTDDDSEVEWMKDADENSLLTAEYDDFRSEALEVRNDQGVGFPFTKGVYLICMLVGAINPYDLDVLDESVPMTKFTYDSLHGLPRPMDEYDAYLNGVIYSVHNQRNPELQQFVHQHRQMFQTEPCHADYLQPVQYFKFHRDQRLPGARRDFSTYQPMALGFLADGSSSGPQPVSAAIAQPIFSDPSAAPSAPYAPMPADLLTGSVASPPYGASAAAPQHVHGAGPHPTDAASSSPTSYVQHVPQPHGAPPAYGGRTGAGPGAVGYPLASNQPPSSPGGYPSPPMSAYAGGQPQLVPHHGQGQVGYGGPPHQQQLQYGYPDPGASRMGGYPGPVPAQGWGQHAPGQYPQAGQYPQPGYGHHGAPPAYGGSHPGYGAASPQGQSGNLLNSAQQQFDKFGSFLMKNLPKKFP